MRVLPRRQLQQAHRRRLSQAGLASTPTILVRRRCAAYKTEGNPNVGRGNAIMAGQVKQFSNAELKSIAATWPACRLNSRPCRRASSADTFATPKTTASDEAVFSRFWCMARPLAVPTPGPQGHTARPMLKRIATSDVSWACTCTQWRVHGCPILSGARASCWRIRRTLLRSRPVPSRRCGLTRPKAPMWPTLNPPSPRRSGRPAVARTGHPHRCAGSGTASAGGTRLDRI